MRKSLWTAAAVLAGIVGHASPAAAHPGHVARDGDFSLWHYLTEPEHAVPIALMLAAGLAAVHFGRRAYLRLTAQSSGASKAKTARGR